MQKKKLSKAGSDQSHPIGTKEPIKRMIQIQLDHLVTLRAQAKDSHVPGQSDSEKDIEITQNNLAALKIALGVKPI
jgi:hypothetical protein